MAPKEIENYLNEKYKGQFIFSLEDSQQQIVAFVDNGTFQNIVGVIETTEEEMNNLINHIEEIKHLI
jgi:hypothetical protein